MTKLAHYGWVRDLPDIRDKHFTVAAGTTIAGLPESVDLSISPFMPPVYDQGEIGSCTANAISAAFDFDRAAQGLSHITPSRLWLYWQERLLEGTTASDAGAAIRDGIKVVKKIGLVPEVDWPYIESKFATTPSPLKPLTAEAKQYESVSYERVTARSQVAMMSCLASGKPFVIGISCYDSFEDQATINSGFVPMPNKKESIIGGHAIVIVGYGILGRGDNKGGQFYWKFRNSWGKSYGSNGYGYLPLKYLTTAGLASDTWVIKTVKS